MWFQMQPWSSFAMKVDGTPTLLKGMKAYFSTDVHFKVSKHCNSIIYLFITENVTEYRFAMTLLFTIIDWLRFNNAQSAGDLYHPVPKRIYFFNNERLTVHYPAFLEAYLPNEWINRHYILIGVIYYLIMWEKKKETTEG